MKTPQRVMAVLKEHQFDDLIIRYTHLLGRMFKPKQIFFIHLPGRHDIPNEILSKYPVLAEPTGEPAHHQIKDLVESHFKPPGDCQVIFEVLKSSSVVELLRFSWKQKIDLILISKPGKKEVDPHDLLAEKIARKAPCPVLLIPVNSKPVIKNILVPVDFSENSGLAFESAIRFASAAKIKQIFCLHVFRVPIEYERTGKSYEEFSRIMEDIASLGYENFIDRMDTGKVEVIPIFHRSDNPVESIQSAAKAEAIDLVVIGNKGRNATLLLGSVSEKLIRITGTPLLVSKRKGIWINLIKTILSWRF
jgi:nucleotide-binding universal stress UspA family protein